MRFHLHPVLFLSTALLLAACGSNEQEPGPDAELVASAGTTPYVWVALGPGGRAVARAVTEGSTCPNIDVDAATHQMAPRSASAPAGFTSILVCEYSLPSGTTSASIGTQALAVPTGTPQQIVVVGDTGCRVKGHDVQDCNGGSTDPWTFPQVADSILAQAPDLLIHVGDFHYREHGTCGTNCDQSTVGYTWASWEADFFQPAQALLPQAPWVFVRGNHEDCGVTEAEGRAWRGWFYLLDVQPLPDDPWTWANCQDYTDPYQVTVGTHNILVMDTSEIPDDYGAGPDTTAVPRYVHEFGIIDSLAAPGTDVWLATHRPFWAVASFSNGGQPDISPTDITLQAALKASPDHGIPAPVKMLLAGHVHLFEQITFTDGRPPQFVFGGGGTELDPAITDALLQAKPEVLQEIGATRANFTHIHDMDYGIITPDATGWTVTLRSTDANPSNGTTFHVDS